MAHFWAGAPVRRVRNVSRQTSLWYVETLLFHCYSCHLPSSLSVYPTLLTTTSVNATCQALGASFPSAATTTRVNRMQQGDMHNIGVAICSRRTVVSTASHVPARMTPPGYSHLRMCCILFCYVLSATWLLFLPPTSLSPLNGKQSFQYCDIHGQLISVSCCNQEPIQQSG